MSHQWDSDREEIERHWKNIGFFQRLIILLMFILVGRNDDVQYIMNRLVMRHDRMVRYKELHWERMESFLWRKL